MSDYSHRDWYADRKVDDEVELWERVLGPAAKTRLARQLLVDALQGGEEDDGRIGSSDQESRVRGEVR